MSRAKSLLSLGFTILVLYAMMFFLREYDFGASQDIFAPKSLAATGFIILAAFAMGEFFRQLGVPALLGYIAAGILFGPNLGPLLPDLPGIPATKALFDENVIKDLGLINILTIGVIGTMGGGELKISEVKDNIGTILLTVLFIFVLAAPATLGIIWVLYLYLPSVVPFLDGLGPNHVWASGILFAAFAIAMSPAATLAIFQETRSQGKFVSLVLGTVVVADLVLVALVLISSKFALILLSDAGFSMGAFYAEIPGIAWEFGSALVVGSVCGLVFILYMRFIKSELLLFTVAAIFATTYVATRLHAEVLLAFLVAGFIVQNASRHGHDMIHALEKISLPVFVVYFMIQAAQLDLKAVAGYLWLTLILTLIRAFGLFFGAKIATHFTKSDPSTKQHLWLAFFSRGGVDLVLGTMIAQTFQPWGVDFQTAIMAIVVVHIVVGPFLLKLALDWTGQTEDARNRAQSESESFATSSGKGSKSNQFSEHVFEDARLQNTTSDLRDVLVSLNHECIVVPLAEKATILRSSILAIDVGFNKALDEIETGIKSSETIQEKLDVIEAANSDYLAAITKNIAAWESMNPVALPTEMLLKITSAIRQQTDFEQEIKVAPENELLEVGPDDAIGIRALKFGRRLSKNYLGRTYRAVPLGRLWRFYVSLSVPRYLESAIHSSSDKNYPLWSSLGTHVRKLDSVLADITSKINSASPVDEFIAEERKGHIERTADLDNKLDAWLSTSVERLSSGLREPHQNFIEAAKIAGTFQLPKFRYRPSTLFDRSRRAEQGALKQLESEEKFVSGHRGWIVMEFQLIEFMYWFTNFEVDTRKYLERKLLEPVVEAIWDLTDASDNFPTELAPNLEEARKRYPENTNDEVDGDGVDPEIDWISWFEENLQPALGRLRRVTQRGVSDVSKGGCSRNRIDLLETRIDAFFEQIDLFAEHPDNKETSSVLTLPMRAWFDSEVLRETTLRFVEFNERAEQFFRAALVEVEGIEQVAEFNILGTVQTTRSGNFFAANDSATSGLVRCDRLTQDLEESVKGGFRGLLDWLFRELDAIEERATKPLLEREISRIEQALERRQHTSFAKRGESWAHDIWRASTDISRRVYGRYEPSINKVVDDLEFLFSDEKEIAENAEIRERLHPYEQAGHSVPIIYRRLFAPVPLDIADFYIQRPSTESKIIQAFDDWQTGNPNSILIRGDRGIGKRSMIRFISETDLSKKNENIHFVLVDDHDLSESGISKSIGSFLSKTPPSTFAGLKRLIRTRDNRPVIIVENGEKLYSRTRTGIRLCREFLKLVDQTADRALWIVLMGDAAATFLETAIELPNFFTHSIVVEPLNLNSIRLMIEKRHRVSGFNLVFDREKPRVYEWVQSPLQSSESVRDPKSAYFREMSLFAEGNPLLALEAWLESVETDAENEQLIRVAQMNTMETQLLKTLTLNKRLTLTALVQHDSLTAQELGIILEWTAETVFIELDHLERLGFVEKTIGEDEVELFHIRDVADGLVTKELRQMNMI